MTATTTLRLRRVRFKDGRTLEVLRPKQFDPMALADEVKKTVVDHCQNSIGPFGCAVVCWSVDMVTTGRVWNSATPLPGILVPDLVRNVLLGNKIEAWTLDTLNGK